MYQDTLQHYFGFDSLRPGQEAVITRILKGQSACAIFPTGSGKSLCYQLPAVQLPHLTLVISPLLALMKDQLGFLHSKNIPAATIDSTQSWEENQQVMQAVRDGTVKVLMISVERLNNERFRQFISNIPISLLVVDEAHCISEWGHNFRPDYLKLPQHRDWMKIPQVLLLTATATPAVIDDMREKFAIAEDNVVVTGFYRPNLDLTITPVEEAQKQHALLEQLSPTQPTIVYVTLQKTAEDLAQWLSQHGFQARAYHAGMDAERRQHIQQAFMNGDCQCIIATIAFGMGIDKADIRRVIHYDLPKSIENYSQEIGRAGRDGQTSHCTVLANKSSLNVLENFVYGDTPDLAAIDAVLAQIQNTNGPWEVILSRLSRDTNIRLLPLKTLLVYLEVHGIIEPQYTYFADYRFKPVMALDAIVAQFQGERQQFVSQIFACSPKARTWHTVDFDALWQHAQAERKRVVAAIDFFSEKGWIELESKQMTDVFRVLEPNFDRAALAGSLYQLFKNKEDNEIGRIQHMISFFESKQCLSHSLAHYFADHRAPEQCGHCSVCRGDAATLPANEAQPEVSANMLQAWCDPFLTACQSPPSTAAVTRFLSGMSSPLNTQLKARQMGGFAKLEAYPFRQVRDHVARLYPDLPE
ncbi:RecQ family ATP-dependent DNA helicase [Photobacterium atrarenae]|uniref:ATP-dependent DNA helicase RecQ n=1 Tax=Photobacterium atrarenae TaxID=865757 RepID=A0ABY5GML1_9GAMM|nr:ATP-dependent DNA helicase RecQ [Photobacterium atrarenae]UTV30330.1 RecQ family ATP-dependent DNA helicase [Photobacterium atrarenae]